MQHIVALEENENGLDRVVLNLLIYVTFCGSLRTAELINALLQSFSLNGSNLHNGQTLRMPELNSSPFSPQSRLDRFMVLKQARGMDFIYFIIHSLVCCTWQQPFCQSVAIIRGTPPLLCARIQFAFGMRKVFSYVGVDLWMWHCCINAPADTHKLTGDLFHPCYTYIQ